MKRELEINKEMDELQEKIEEKRNDIKDEITPGSYFYDVEKVNAIKEEIEDLQKKYEELEAIPTKEKMESEKDSLTEELDKINEELEIYENGGVYYPTKEMIELENKKKEIKKEIEKRDHILEMIEEIEKTEQELDDLNEEKKDYIGAFFIPEELTNEIEEKESKLEDLNNKLEEYTKERLEKNNRPTQTQPAQSTPVQATPAQATQAQPAQSTPVQATPAQATQAQPAQARPVQPAQARPVQATPAQARPVQATPAQATQAQPAQARPVQPAQARPVQATPAKATTEIGEYSKPIGPRTEKEYKLEQDLKKKYKDYSKINLNHNNGSGIKEIECKTELGVYLIKYNDGSIDSVVALDKEEREEAHEYFKEKYGIDDSNGIDINIINIIEEIEYEKLEKLGNRSALTLKELRKFINEKLDEFINEKNDYNIIYSDLGDIEEAFNSEDLEEKIKKPSRAERKFLRKIGKNMAKSREDTQAIIRGPFRKMADFVSEKLGITPKYLLKAAEQRNTKISENINKKIRESSLNERDNEPSNEELTPEEIAQKIEIVNQEMVSKYRIDKFGYRTQKTQAEINSERSRKQEPEKAEEDIEHISSIDDFDI